MYQFNSRVRYSETDIHSRLSVTGIINYLQDCSTFQSEDIGKGLAYLEKRRRAWFLSNWQIIIDRYPTLGQEIAVGTWPYDFKGIYGSRNFFIRDMEGNYMVRANSLWFLFDLDAQRPARVTAEDIAGYDQQKERIPMEYAPRKIAVPDEYAEGQPVVVGKHHLDTNHHVNNAQYVEIAREFLPDDFLIGELRVEYRKAAVLGAVMSPRISRGPEGYIVSLCDGTGRPYAVIWLKEKKL